MKQLLLILSLVLFVAACASTSSNSDITTVNRLPTDEEVVAWNQTHDFDDQIVCSIETRLGSTMRRRVCYTRAQIAETAEQNAILQDQARDDRDF